MASSSRSKYFQQNQAQEDEVEHFDDFTIASSWERFISDIEAISRQWMADGSNNLLKKGATQVEISSNLYKVKSDLKHVSKTYSIEYYFKNGNDGKVADWNLNLHDLQLCFGVKDFLVIAPQSASGVILDSPEASKLLSAVAIALSNCSSLWPAFVPVHDPTRKAFIGIQNMGTIFTRRFEADRMGSQVPRKLLHLEGLYELFVSKFAYTSLDLSVHLFKVLFTMKLTYRILPYNDDEVEGADAEITESGLGSSISAHNNAQWDDDCSWSDWYSAEDPVKGFELITIWSENMVENSMTMAELENFSPHESKNWILFPILSPNITKSLEGNIVGFSSQLSHLIDTLVMSFGAQFMEDFISVENPTSDNLKSSMVLPPPTAIDRVLKELFHNGEKVPGFSKSDSRTSRGIKGAPQESLFAHFCLHALWFGNCNIRAIALFWIEFVREVRWYWEESQPLPRMPVSGSIDLSTCLIHQKLQMLAICIDQKRQLNEEYQDCESQDLDSSCIDVRILEDGLTQGDSFIMHTPGENFDGNMTGEISNSSDDEHESVRNELKSGTKSGEGLFSHKRHADMIRRGSAGVVGNMVLLNSSQSLHAPFTQDAPLMTEDMHEERLKAVEVFGDSFNFSAQLEKDILASDMQAFKAANPDAVFEDFIRWHSPGDWVDDLHIETRGVSTSEVSKENLPPRGHLSKRMSEHGNLWRQIWNEAPVLPVSEQKPLLDPNREGEKIIHYLETLRPHQLLEQMVCTAFKASADTLNQTSYGGLKQMKTKMDQLYATMASVLKALQAHRLFSDSEITEDLKRLCAVFEHVEKLLTLAASLHRKLGQAPRLAESIFKDFYDFYLPRMGSGSIKIKDQQDFGKKQAVRSHERPVVSNLFTPPTANQSWRKVLSMGNLLNGHEPILREIIFSTHDSMSGNHYAATTPGVQEKEIETHRMYVCGSSNDLRVALSVTSCD